MNRINNAKASSSWGNLSKKDRKKVLAALKSKYPSDKYEEIIKKYNKAVIEGETR